MLPATARRPSVAASNPQPRIGIGFISAAAFFHTRHTRKPEKNGTSRPWEYCGSLIHLSPNTTSVGQYAHPRTTTSAPTWHNTARAARAGAVSGASGTAGLIEDIRAPITCRACCQSKACGILPHAATVNQGQVWEEPTPQ